MNFRADFSPKQGRHEQQKKEKKIAYEVLKKEKCFRENSHRYRRIVARGVCTRSSPVVEEIGLAVSRGMVLSCWVPCTQCSGFSICRRAVSHRGSNRGLPSHHSISYVSTKRHIFAPPVSQRRINVSYTNYTWYQHSTPGKITRWHVAYSPIYGSVSQSASLNRYMYIQ